MRLKVSVIIPVFNAEKYLRQCLDSIKRQTLNDFEVICIDDGSNDESAIILKEYEQSDSRFRIITQANSGVSIARNNGIKNAKGQYLCFIDADDYVQDNYLYDTYNLAVENNADIVIFGGKSFPSTDWIDKKLSPKNNIVQKDGIIKTLFENNACRPFVWNKLYKTELIQKNNLYFSADLSLGEDQAFIFDVFPFAVKIVFFDEKYYLYRQQTNSAMGYYNSDIERKIEEHLKVVQYVVNSWQEKNLLSKYGNFLLKWIITFLHYGLDECSYNFRRFVYQKIIEYYKNIAKHSSINRENKHKINIISDKLLITPPIISIIMPVYNSEMYLEETLQCLNKQTFNKYELILIDDGSSDGSYEILNDYAKGDNRVTVLQQQHQYAGAARNLGISIAKGDYLIFLDADDFFDTRMLECAYEKIKINDADICVFKADKFDHVTKVKSAMPWTMKQSLCPRDVFSASTNRKNIFCFTTPAPWNKLFKKDFIINNGLMFQETRSANDMAFVMTALALASKIVTLDRVLLTYRVNNKNSLQGSQNKKPEAFYEALLELRRRLIDYKVMDIVEAAFVNFSLDCCFYNLGTLTSEESYNQIYNLIRDKALTDFYINDKKEDYFYAYKANNIWPKLQDMQILTSFEFAVKYKVRYLQEKSKLILQDKQKGNYFDMNAPLVSIVMPSLNVARYFDECLQSVLSQTYKNIEVICVDAGSTDGTLEIIQFYMERDSRIKLIKSEVKSYGYQVNLGLKEAAGKYFSIVETDDYVVPEMLNIFVDRMETNNLDFVKADFCKFIGDGEQREFTYFPIAPNSSMYETILDPSENFEIFKAPLYTWTGIYRTQFLKDNNIWHNETLGASYQDNGFWFQTMIYAKRIMFIDKVYYKLRRDNQNSSFFSKSKVFCICDEYDFIRKLQ